MRFGADRLIDEKAPLAFLSPIPLVAFAIAFTNRGAFSSTNAPRSSEQSGQERDLFSKSQQ